MTIRLAIVDDHPLVTGGLDAALGTIDGLEVVAHGASVIEARELLAREDLDVVLLDVRLEDGNGIQALAERGARQRPAVLVISGRS
jgi:two-component system, NarL family, response regulator LiaR